MNIYRATFAHAGAIADIYRPHVEDGTASFERDAPDAREIAKRISDAGDAYPWLVAEINGQVAGYAYASAHRTRYAYRWSVDTAIYVDTAAHRRGVGRGLYTVLLDVLCRQNFAMAFAGITLPNGPSQALHQALGFELVARYPNVGFKQGAWRDTEWWARPLAPLKVPPADLLKVPASL